MGHRRLARELALAALYESEFHNTSYAAVVLRLKTDQELKDEVVSFLEQLLKAYVTIQDKVNTEIESHSSHWKISRMAIIDRNILRLGITELLSLTDIPKNVTINEYLEIAKKFGTEDSCSFVNGILDKIEKK